MPIADPKTTIDADLVLTGGRLWCARKGLVEDADLIAKAGVIIYAGPKAEAPTVKGTKSVDLGGGLITPGLIDPHTHLVYAGSRASEFARRMQGETYADIARSGGGILTTVMATRAESEAALIDSALKRLDAAMACGVTTIEIKSGYGLTLESELKMLRVARTLGTLRPVRIVTSLLAAHAVPPEFRGDSDGYIDWICREMIPVAVAEGLADMVDGYCESIAFSLSQMARIFESAIRHGLKIKLHAEQLSDQKGAILAAQMGAVSVDHLEYIGPDGIAALAGSKTVATLLPGAYYYTRETQKPPISAMIDAEIPLAIGTDCNPGTSPMISPLLAMNMAAVLFGLGTETCLKGMTQNAAQALGQQDRIGTLDVGKACDLAIWDVAAPSELVAGIGLNPLKMRIFAGQITEPHHD